MSDTQIFRVATPADADAVARIYDEARRGFRERGIPQWQAGKPDRDSFLADVRSGTARVLVCNGTVAATCQSVTYEPSYDRLVGGEWHSDSYVAVHRVAVDEAYRRQGLASRMLCEAEAYAASIGKQAVRIDTHERNVQMRSMLEKNGYARTGTIFLSDGSPRFSFEKLIK